MSSLLPSIAPNAKRVNCQCIPSFRRVNKTVAKSWCYTQVEVVDLSYLWAINNFSFSCRDGKEVIKSSIFSVSPNDGLKWSLSLHPADDLYYIYLLLASSNKSKITAKCKIAVLNSKREEAQTMESRCQFEEGFNFGFKQSISRDFLLDEANDLLPEDKLTIICTVSYAGNNFNICGQSRNIKFETPETKLSMDFEHLLASKKFSDVTLNVGGHEFKVHKTILAARSDVFAAMFEHEMEESITNRVTITDIYPEVVKELLYYIYTGKTPNLDKMPNRLLAAADKYALEELKLKCEDEISSNISIDTAVEILILADLHSAYKLKGHAIDFINAHAMDISKTLKWQNMVTTHPHLVSEIFVALAIQLSPIETTLT